jgi:hypothetical protein
MGLGLLAAASLACGPEGGLPGGKDAGEQVVPPPEPPEASREGLWPLVPGSRWVYRIDDPARGEFQKVVTVHGEEEIPETTSRGVRVHSAQPHLEERSWQLLADGVALRVREEDRKGGQLVRVMTWSPAVMKSLSAHVEPGWTREEAVREVERDGTGAVVKERDKTFGWTLEAIEPITTPAGTFPEAYRLRRHRAEKDDWERLYWLVPGVGKVREEGPRTEELLEYVVP